ncbi:MAG: VCBS repeat-containing protein [Polyangiaceae bacterium]|nr:VCBS repeat-containing protein [Polyangiaceae bacterium]
MAPSLPASRARLHSVVPFLLFLLSTLSGITRAHGGGHNGEPKEGEPPPPGDSPSPPGQSVCPTSGAQFPPDLIQTNEPANAGAIEGVFSVNAAGDPRYEIPLVPVPGRAGMAPQISLVCDGAGDGPQGVGCSLQGFSRITRCPKNRAQDGVIAPIAYDDTDAYCMDGRRLVLVGKGGGFDEYRTIPDSFSKVQAFFPSGWDSSLGPKSFRVFTKDGVTVDYGSTEDSRALAKNGAYRAWWVARTTDRSDNFIEYAYSNTKNTTEDPAQPYTNELLPVRISYTGHANLPATRSVDFQYNLRPPAAIRTTFAGGMELRDSKLLTAIEMRGPGNALVRRYALGYGVSATTGRSQMVQVSECADVGGPCKPPTRLTWNAPPTGFEQVATDLPIPQYEGASVITTDFDGNAIDDIVMIDGEPSGVPVSRFYTATNRGATEGFFGHTYTAAYFLDFNLIIDRPVYRERATPIDFDHDGRQDLFLHDVNGTSTNWQVLRTLPNDNFEKINTGITRPFPGGQTAPTGLKGPEASAHLLDMDGDGMADIVTCTKGAVFYDWTYRAWTETGFSSTTEAIPVLGIQPCDSEAYTVDVDGDGKAELLVREMVLSNGTPQPQNNYSAISRRDAGDYVFTLQNIDGVPAGGGMFFLDANGDGLSDAVQTGYSDHQLWVFINTGRGFRTRVNAIPGNVFSADEFAHLATAIDFDNDGRQDLLLPMKEGSTSWVILRSNGNGTFSPVPAGIPFDTLFTQEGVSLAHPLAPRVFEADGDGANDVLLPIGNTFHVFRNRAKFADSLATITDGMAPYDPSHPAFRPQVAIEYGTLAQSNAYDKGEDCEYPIRCVAGSRRVVKAYERDMGGAEARRFELFYRDARYHRLGRGLLGFAERVVLDVDKNAGRLELYDNTTYDSVFNSFPFAGQPSEVISWTPTLDNDDLVFELSFQTTTLQVAPTNNGTSYFTLPVSTRIRREQGRINEVVWAVGYKGSHEGYARDAYYGATDTTRLSDAIRTVLDFDHFGNVLEEKTLFGREFTLFGGSLDSQADLIDKLTRTFKNNPAKWQIGLLKTDEQCSTASGAGGTTCRLAEHVHDALARLKSSTTSTPGDADTWVRVAFERDSYGNITKTTAQDAFEGKRIACTAYEPEGVFPYSQRNPEGHITFTKFHPGFGAPLAGIDPNGRVTQWAYDEYGRVTLEKRPDGTETATIVTRTQDGGPQQDQYVVRISTSTPGWAQDLVELDRLGRPIRQWSRGTTIDGVLGPRMLQETEYDDRGEFVKRTLVPIWESTLLAERKYHAFERDNLGRVTKHVSPWATATETHYEGTKVRVVSPGAGMTTTEIDGLGRPIEVEDALGGITSYTYGPFGYVRTVTDPGGAVTTTLRDAAGRVRTLTDPDRGTTITHYSGFGEARSTLDALGRPTQFFYDRLGRMVQRFDVDGETRWTYDTAANGIGAIAAVLSPTGVNRRWSYDTAGRTVATELNTGSETFTIGFDYDPQSRLSTITYPPADGVPFVVENHYDDAAHLVRVNEVDPTDDLWTLAAVSRNGFISGERFGNNAVSTIRAYDEARGRVSTIFTTGQAVMQSLSFTYDSQQNLETRTDHLQMPLGRVETFQYDALQRLRCAWFDGQTPCAREWKYAPNGNFTSTTAAGTYTYDPLRPHIVDNTNLGSYFHDAVGNQTSRPDATVEYRAFDLPKQINWQNSDVTTFDYDGNRRRIRKTSGVVESIFMDDLYERVTNFQTSVVEHRYHVRSSERTVAVVTRSTGGKKTQFLHTDHLGSIDVVSNENGGVDERRSYDPFGARRNPEWGKPPGTLAAGTTFGFTGHLGDEELGLVYMRGRVYDPNLGRFLTADPFIANPLSGQNWNRYAYVANNPLKYTDPSGFTGEDPAAPPGLLDNNGNPVAGGGSLEVWVFGKSRNA